MTAPSLLDELEPCPFCGTTDVEAYPADRERSRWNVCCGNPGCVTRGDNDYLTEADAIAAWNRRTHHAEIADMANELRVARESFKRCDEICKCTAEGWRTAEEDMAKRLEAAERDSKRLDFMECEHCTVRAEATCDDDVFYEVVDHYMAEPQERVIGSGATPRDALDAAIDATQEGE